TVIGVMPAKFEFPIPIFGVQGNQFEERVDIWKPIAFTPVELKERGSRSYGLIARLRPEVSAATAQAELDTIISNWIRAYPDNYRGGGFGAKVYTFQDKFVGGMRNGLAFLDGEVVYVFFIAVGTGILFGLIPALSSVKPELTEALKEGGRGSTTGARRNLLRNSLVVAEIALALVLLVGAGLLLKSYTRLQNIDPGFDRRS